MTTDVQAGPTQADLIALLDPERNYGDRTHEEVVRDVINGVLYLLPGYNLPCIRDASTHRNVKGSGRPAGSQGIQQAAISAFRKLAIDDIDEAYRELRSGMKAGDPRFHKIYWETLAGKVGEIRGVDEMGKAMQMIIERLDRPESRTIPIEQVASD